MFAAARRRELNGPSTGPAGQAVLCALTAASGLLLPLAVEVVPSHEVAGGAVPCLGLVFWFLPALHPFVIVRRHGCFTTVAHVCGR